MTGEPRDYVEQNARQHGHNVGTRHRRERAAGGGDARYDFADAARYGTDYFKWFKQGFDEAMSEGASDG